MPCYNMTIEAISREEAKRYAGMAAFTDFPAHILEHACEEARLLSSPRAVWEMFSYDDLTGTILKQHSQTDAPDTKQERYTLSGSSIVHHLKGAVQAAVLAVTIGPALEQKVSECFSAGDYTKGLLLDAAGTAAVEAAADKANSYIEKLEERRGLAALVRFSPGYGDWNISDQPMILALSGGNSVGITVTKTCMLLPRKSITAIIGFIPKTANQDLCRPPAAYSCYACPHPNCHSRKGICRK